MQSTSLSIRLFRHLRCVSPKANTYSAFNSKRDRTQPAHSYCLRAVQKDKLDLAPGEVDVWWLQPEKARQGQRLMSCHSRQFLAISKHLFTYVQVADPGLLQRYMQLLTKQEQAYVSEGSSEAVRKERLLARTLQRTTLARYLLLYTNNRSSDSCHSNLHSHLVHLGPQSGMSCIAME